MRNKPMLLSLLLLIGLSSCRGGQENTSNSSSSLPQESSTAKGTVTKLRESFENLSYSFTAKGSLKTLTSITETGSTFSDDAQYNCLIQVGEDSYYYEESDLLTKDIQQVDNFYANDKGKLVTRSLNLLTNQIDENVSSQDYDDIMKNTFADFTDEDMKTVKAISKKPGWYQFVNWDKINDLVRFLTGYSAGEALNDSNLTLNVSQFAFHFDGDQIDQFRILLNAEENEDDYSYVEQLLFELDLFDILSTHPQSIKPLEHTSKHDSLKQDLDALSKATNYTINIQDEYENKDAPSDTYHYLVDSENLYCDKVQYVYKKNPAATGDDTSSDISSSEEDDERTRVAYTRAYKNLKKGNEQRPYIIDFGTDDNHTVVDSYDLNEYITQSTSLKYHFQDILPMFSYFAPEIFKDEGDYLTTYITTKDYCFLTLLPVVEQTSGMTLKVYLKDDGSLDKFTMEGQVSYWVSEDNYGTSNLLTMVTYSDLGTTVIPDFVKNYTR